MEVRKAATEANTKLVSSEWKKDDLTFHKHLRIIEYNNAHVK